MPKITFNNTNQSFEVPSGCGILECAIQNDVPLEHACGGNCACTTCHIIVEEGLSNLNSMGEDERSLLESNDKLDEKSRLGCQSRIKSGAVIVRWPE